MTAETNGPGREPVAWRWRPKGAEVWIYDPSREWMELQGDAIEKQPLYAALPVPPANRDAEPVTCWRYLHGHAHCPDAAPPAAPLPAADADARDIRAAIACLRREGFPGLAAAIEQQARELAEMTIRAECAEMVCRDKDADWVTENARAKSAEADRDALAEKLRAAEAVIAAADAMREYISRSCGPAVSAYDAARAKAAP